MGWSLTIITLSKMSLIMNEMYIIREFEYTNPESYDICVCSKMGIAFKKCMMDGFVMENNLCHWVKETEDEFLIRNIQKIEFIG